MTADGELYYSDMRKRLFGKSKRRERSYSPDQRRMDRERDDRRGRGGRGDDRGYRERDRRDRDRDYDRRDRDRDYDRRGRGDRDRDYDRRDRGGGEETDEERRARIAQWNRDRSDGRGGDGGRGAEETDEQRRARIAEWNREREPTNGTPVTHNEGDRPRDDRSAEGQGYAGGPPRESDAAATCVPCSTQVVQSG